MHSLTNKLWGFYRPAMWRARPDAWLVCSLMKRSPCFPWAPRLLLCIQWGWISFFLLWISLLYVFSTPFLVVIFNFYAHLCVCVCMHVCFYNTMYDFNRVCVPAVAWALGIDQCFQMHDSGYLMPKVRSQACLHCSLVNSNAKNFLENFSLSFCSLLLLPLLSIPATNTCWANGELQNIHGLWKSATWVMTNMF